MNWKRDLDPRGSAYRLGGRGHAAPAGIRWMAAIATACLVGGWHQPIAAQEATRRDTVVVEVDLSEDVLPSIQTAQENALERAWYQNFELTGFGAFGFLDSGEGGTTPNGAFQIQEATLFVETDIWRSSSIFVEIQTNRLGDDDSKFIRTGEVYGHFRDLVSSESVTMGLKAGRIDIPFGEEYLTQDAPDNPLISFSAAYPYGWDEGVLLYGSISGLGWIASVTDGTDDRSAEDDPAKALNLKLYGDLFDRVYLSGSVMRNGAAGKSAIEFGGSHFQPVGASHTSALGASGSTRVDALLYEIDGKLHFRTGGRRAYISGSFGQAFQDDAEDVFDRDLRWHSIEALATAPRGVYAAARFSEIGTYDALRGFHFDGKPTAGGNGQLGYDVMRFRRVSLGVGWDPNPQVRIKVEVGQDDFDLIQAAAPDPSEGRVLFGLGLTMRY